MLKYFRGTREQVAPTPPERAFTLVALDMVLCFNESVDIFFQIIFIQLECTIEFFFFCAK